MTYEEFYNEVKKIMDTGFVWCLDFEKAIIALLERFERESSLISNQGLTQQFSEEEKSATNKIGGWDSPT